MLKQVPKPSKVEGNQVLLATHSVGICGSDVHYWTHGCIGHFIVKAPMILGHETSATVVEIGSKVKNLKVGDRVAIEPGVPCRICDFCKEGRYNLCPDVYFAATPPDDGHLTRYFLHPEDFCFKLPDHVSFEEGAFLEPLSVGVHACKRAGIETGSNVLITGAGPIGLVTLLVSKAFGAASICITDINEKRLALAKKVGATHTLLIRDGVTAEESAKEVHRLMKCVPDRVVDCNGGEATLRLGILAIKNGGNMAVVGHGPSDVKIPIVNATAREVNIIGIFRYRNCYPISLELIASGKVDVKPLITHRFPLEKAVDAFEMAKSGQGIKVMIKCAKE